MNRLVAKPKGKVSTIFLTHPDEDHYNYLLHFAQYKKDKIPNIYLGGSQNLWNVPKSKPKEFVDQLKKSNIYSGPTSLNYNVPSLFTKGNSKRVNICEGLMTMEIIYGGHNRLENSLVK